jgi:trehalose/maltose hydrolase-like predicted phosphorylase
VTDSPTFDHAARVRYEGLLLTAPDGRLEPGALEQIRALRVAGVHVGIVGTVDGATIDALAADECTAALVLSDAQGVEVVIVDESGAAERRNSGVEALSVLEKAGRTVVERLATMSVDARSDTVGAGAVLVAVGDAEAGADDQSGGSIPSAVALVDLVRDVAFDAGLTDTRVFLDDDSRLLLALGDEADARRAVLDAFWQRGIAPDSVLVIAPSTAGDIVAAELDAQIAARATRQLPGAAIERGWSLTVDEFHSERDAVESSWFVLADGRIGASGAPLGEATAATRWLLAAGVYTGEGPQTHLLNGPVWWHVPIPITDDAPLRRVLDLRAGLVYEHLDLADGEYKSVRFCSLARPGTAVLRIVSATAEAGTALLVSPDGESSTVHSGAAADVQWMRVVGTGGGIVAATIEDRGTGTSRGDGVVRDQITAYDAERAHAPDPEPAVARTRHSAGLGFDVLLNEHRRAWGRRWEDADVIIDGDDALQVATRFALFHLMASVGDHDEAAVGARGLTGPSYRGHVFWDADTFVLPFLAATHPQSARAMLEYRVRRLPAAMDAARRAGRGGARFPWESADAGDDVTPPSAHDRTGRVVPIRTGQLEDHIVAQVAWATCFYVDWTGDDDFARGPGQRLLIETARYWASRARTESDGSAHIYGVIGPDEYHEPVDDSAFTNVMARWNLRRALAALRRGAPSEDVSAVEQGEWSNLADALVDGYDANTGVYEQFAGFHELEPLLIEELAPRRPIAADLLLGADRVRASQIIKQADVLMLYHVVPEEVAADSLEPNLRYYEPRTAHGSSLSPSIHAAIFARARDYDHALAALRIASAIDLEDLTGSTTGGLHLATMGGLWQSLAFGFAGLRIRDGLLHVDPRLPPTWRSLELRVRFRGSRVRVRVESTGFEVIADEPIAVAVAGESVTVGPKGRAFHRKGTSWEVQR